MMINSKTKIFETINNFTSYSAFVENDSDSIFFETASTYLKKGIYI